MSVREENIRLRIQATSEIPVVTQQFEELAKMQRLVAQQLVIQTGEMRQQSEAQIKAIGGVTDALKGQRTAVQQHKADVSDADKAYEAMGKQVRNVATLIGTAFTLNEIKSFGMEVIDAKTKIDSLKIALDVMLGSKKQSTELFNEIVALAKKTPFSLDEVAENVVKLKAYNIATKDLVPTVEALGNMAAAVGKEKLPQLTLAYGQVINLGKLMGTETRQFIEAGIPLYDLLADSMKKPKEEVIKLAQNHQIMASDVQKAVMETAQVGGRYYNMMVLQSQTLGGQVSNLADSFFVAKARVGDFFENGLKGGIKILSNLVEATMGSDNAIKRTISTFGAAVTAWVAARTALALLDAQQKINAGNADKLTLSQRLLTLNTEAMAAAQATAVGGVRALSAAIAANPIGAFLTLISLATSAFLTFEAATENVSEAMGEQQFQIQKEQSELNRLAEAAMGAEMGTRRRKEAVELLIAKYPEYFSGINAEKATNEQLKGILDKVNESFKARINLAKESYNAEKNADKQRALWDQESEAIERLVKKMPELEKYKNDASAVIKILETRYNEFHTSVKDSVQPHQLATLMGAEWMKAGAETLKAIKTNQQKLEAEQSASDARIANAKKKAQEEEIAQVKDFYARQIKEAAGNKKEIARLEEEQAAKIAEINGTVRKKELEANEDFNNKKKLHISQTEIEIMKIRAKTGEKTLEEEYKLADLLQKKRIDDIQKLELSEKEKAKRIEKVVAETQPKIDALKAELQIKSVSATNVAIEKLEAQSGERRLKEEMRLLDLREKAEIETVNKSKIAYEEKEKQIKAIIEKYEPQHKALRLQYEEIKNQELIQSQIQHNEKIKVLTTQRLEAEKILTRLQTAKTEEERLALIQEYGKKVTDEVKDQALEQLKINLDAAQEWLDQVRLTEGEKSDLYKQALKQRNAEEQKYEQARTQQAIASNNAYYALVQKTEERIRELRKQTAEQEKQNLEKGQDFRNGAIRSILDLFGQANPVVSQFGGTVMTIINNMDVLSGKTVENAKKQVESLKQVLTHLNILKDSGLQSGEQIEKTKEGIAQTKLDLAKAEGEAQDIEMKAFDSTMMIFSMVYQVLSTVVNAINESIRATNQAIADAYKKAREVMTDFYDTMIDANQQALDLALEGYEGSFAQREKIIKDFYAEELAIAQGKEKLDAELYYAQRVAQIRADAGGNIGKFLKEMEQLNREKIAREGELEVKALEHKIALAERLKNERIAYMEQELDAFKEAKEAEIDAAEAANDAQENLLKEALANFKEAKEAEIDAVETAKDQKLQALKDELDAFKDARNQEVEALSESLRKQKELTEQFYSDKSLRMTEDDIYRRELLTQGEAREVAALEAAKQRELERATSADERTRIVNAFEKLIAQTHAEYQQAIGDKTKETSLANQEIKAQETEKVKALETEAATAIGILKDQIAAKEKETANIIRQTQEESAAQTKELKDQIAAKDKETQELIKQNNQTTAAEIQKLKDQIAAKDKEVSDAIKAENRAYAKLRIELEWEILDVKKQTAIAEMRAEQALLRSKRWFLNKGRVNDAINEIEQQIAEINGAGGKSEVLEKMERAEQLADNISQNKQAQADTEKELAGIQQRLGEKRQQIETARQSGQDTTSLDKELNDLLGQEDLFKNLLAHVLGLIAKQEAELKALGYFEGTEYVDRGGLFPNGVDTVSAKLTRGERVLTVDQNNALNGITNEELVRRAKLFDDFTQAYPSLNLSSLLSDISSLRIGLPEGIMTGADGGRALDLSGLRDDLKGVKKAIESQKLLNVNIDRNGFRMAELSAQSKVTYHQNLLTR